MSSLSSSLADFATIVGSNVGALQSALIQQRADLARVVGGASGTSNIESSIDSLLEAFDSSARLQSLGTYQQYVALLHSVFAKNPNNYLGSDAVTGVALGGLDHLRQSIKDILFTPVGARVMRRDYGSRLFELMDSAMNSVGIFELKIAVAEAIRAWEPRIKLSQVLIYRDDETGRFELELVGEYTPTGQRINLDGIEL